MSKDMQRTQVFYAKVNEVRNEKFYVRQKVVALCDIICNVYLEQSFAKETLWFLSSFVIICTSVLLESREPNKSLLATSPLLPSGRHCTFPQSMSRILENAKVIYAKYYKNSNKFVPYCFLSDWPVRSVLILSAILLKYYLPIVTNGVTLV